MFNFNRKYYAPETGGATGGAAAPVDTGAVVGGATGAAPAAGAPGSTTPAAPAVWTDGLTDPAIRDFAINKGYNKYAANEAAPVILQQYQNLEKLFGADRAGRVVEVPDFEKGDAASLNAFYDRVGRPKEGKDYDLALPQTGVDPEFDAWARNTFHGAGLSGKQANAVGKAYMEFGAAQTAKALAADQARFANEDKALKTEWGAAYDNKMSVAAAAAKSLGVKPEVLDALQKVAGYGDVMRTFANIAEKIGEDKFVGGDGGGFDGKMTPAEASAELKRMLGDKEIVAALMDKNHPKRAEYMAKKAKLTAMEVGVS